MPLWTQHLLVVLAVIGCAAFILRQAVESLRGRKSKLNGCGTCNSCGTTPQAKQPADERVAIIPVDMLRRRS